MPEVIKVKTGNKFEEIGSYSRLVAVDNMIFVSNTAGRNPRTKLIPEDLAEQANQVIDNVAAALASVDAVLEDIVSARVYVQFPEEIDTIMGAYAERMRGIKPALTMTCPPLGSAQYRVEMDCIAIRGVSKANAKEMVISL